MYIAKSQVTTKKKSKRSITNMLRKERKWNNLKCSIKTMKGGKE